MEILHYLPVNGVSWMTAEPLVFLTVRSKTMSTVSIHKAG